MENEGSCIVRQRNCVPRRRCTRGFTLFGYQVTAPGTYLPKGRRHNSNPITAQRCPRNRTRDVACIDERACHLGFAPNRAVASVLELVECNCNGPVAKCIQANYLPDDPPSTAHDVSFADLAAKKLPSGRRGHDIFPNCHGLRIVQEGGSESVLVHERLRLPAQEVIDEGGLVM